MTSCPVCQNTLNGNEPVCPKCGHFLPARPVESVTPPAATPVPPPEGWVGVPAYSAPFPDKRSNPRISFAQPVWQFVLLQFCSFGLYYLIWFYQCWQLIKERRGWDITPAARAIFAVFWIRSMCQEIFNLAAPTGVKAGGWPVTIATVVISSSLLGRAADRAPEPLPMLLSLGILALQVLIMLPVVNALYAFWRHEQPHLPVRKSLSGGAWATVIIGGLLWALVVASLFIPEA